MHRQMHRPALVRFALGIGVLMVMILALAACGSGSAQEEAKARPLPQYEHPLRSGEYHSVKFKPPSPSRSARAGQTPKISCPTLSN